MALKKQPLTSTTQSEFTLEALRQIVPSAFTEVRDADGNLVHKVDFEVLRELLGDAILDGDEERFGFHWVGKQEAKRAAAEPIRKTLRPVLEDSVDWDTTENLYIEGDNLEVLKLLQRAYLGKVKMIYIDPPYNTGNDFVYDDDFSMSGAELDAAMGNVDAEGNRLRKNLDSNPRYHSDWCSMIYSRLLVARTLLANDGVIFISIDDNEVHHLRKICDEVFGADNYIDCYVWESTFRPDNSSPLKRSNAESILLYTKDKNKLQRLYGTIEQSQGLPSLTKNSMKVTTLSFRAGVVKTFLPDGIYPAGDKGSGYTLHNTIEVKDGLVITDFTISGRVIWGQDYLDKELEQGTEIIIKSGTFILYSKKRATSSAPNTIIPNNRVGDVLQGRSDVVNLFQSAVFSYPKPVSLVKYLAELLNDKNALILDFFSGSATTAHAVMQLNAEDGGKRKYICVQLPEATPEGSEACKAGYSTICEIGKERIRRAGKKIKEEHPEVANSLDTGFRVLRVDSSNMKDVYFEPAQLSQANLFEQVDNVKAGRTELDLLFGCMVDWGVNLSLPLRKEEVAGKSLHIVNAGELVACFDSAINLEVIRYIAGLNPLRVILRETCFTSDVDKLNLYEQFKQFCGWSDEEAYKRIHVI